MSVSVCVSEWSVSELPQSRDVPVCLNIIISVRILPSSFVSVRLMCLSSSSAYKEEICMADHPISCFSIRTTLNYNCALLSKMTENYVQLRNEATFAFSKKFTWYENSEIRFHSDVYILQVFGYKENAWLFLVIYLFLLITSLSVLISVFDSYWMHIPCSRGMLACLHSLLPGGLGNVLPRVLAVIFFDFQASHINLSKHKRGPPPPGGTPIQRRRGIRILVGNFEKNLLKAAPRSCSVAVA